MTQRRIRRPTAWRLMLLAFALWAGVFIIGYAGALLAPDHAGVDIALVALAIIALPLLWVIDRTAAGLPERSMVRGAVAVAGTAILFNALASIG